MTARALTSAGSRISADCTVLLAFADEAALTNLAQQFYELDIILGGKVRQPSQQLIKENRSFIPRDDERGPGGGQHAAGRLARTSPTRRDHGRSKTRDRANPAEQGNRRPGHRVSRGNPPGPSWRSTTRRLCGRTWSRSVQPHNTFAGTQSCANATQALTRRGPRVATPGPLPRSRRSRPMPIPTASAAIPSDSARPPGSGATPPRRARSSTWAARAAMGRAANTLGTAKSGGEVAMHFRPVGAGDCQKCHHGEFSRPFDYATFWPDIAHGKEVAASRLPWSALWSRSRYRHPLG